MVIVDWLNSLGEFGEWAAGRKPVTKRDDALRFGILGAAKIAPNALVVQARSHPDAIIVAVAARDKKKAEAYAKRWNIPIVHDSYEALIALIADPSIDCIYNPLPNGLHYIYTLAALKAGKHVLLEKPSVSNAEEARSLFHHPVLSAPNAPVLVEASHYRFHPAWNLFLSQFNKADIEHAEARAAIPAGLFSGEDIRFDFNLAGGCAMDLGHYTLSALRGVFGTEPVEVTSATPRPIPEPYDQRCDQAMAATYLFPNGGTGAISADLGARGGYWFPLLTSNWPSFRDGCVNVQVKLRAEDLGMENGMKKSRQTKIVFWGFMLPHLWHRIDVATTTTLRDPFSDAVVMESKDVKKKKAYTWADGRSGESKGQDWWATYRYQLEEFVNRIKGREGSGAWVDGEESIKQMVATDQTYEKAGLPLRPTSEKLE
ncbi:oxidoreductase domain-containing protein [Stemphylium lycopersici]|uniref:D-xylose 1-dehydrogenase (NADP(+), D-xylono-1,5-lactone-forming) n=1 Tax=Stemphylium lycopersici TaxID=183478 RepID=A0A364N232_STELY|nr:oxidoreductase domain-containing protein [Stemphylium lycopersici]